VRQRVERSRPEQDVAPDEGGHRPHASIERTQAGDPRFDAPAGDVEDEESPTRSIHHSAKSRSTETSGSPMA
jgi:hypothetical protein